MPRQSWTAACLWKSLQGVVPPSTTLVLRAPHGRRLRMLQTARMTPPSLAVSSILVRSADCVVRVLELTAATAGALRLATLLGSSANERDDIVVHCYQLLLAAMRRRSSCSSAIEAEVMSCVDGQDGYARYIARVRVSRDAATRLFGLELLREFCRTSTTSWLHPELADEYYTSSASLLPLSTSVDGTTSAKYTALFAGLKSLSICRNIRHVGVPQQRGLWPDAYGPSPRTGE